MALGLFGKTCLLFGGFAAGGAYTYIDMVGGEGTARTAFQHGTGQAAGVAGDLVATPVQVLQQVKPSLAAAAGEVSNVAGGVADSSAPSAGEYGDPAEESP